MSSAMLGRLASIPGVSACAIFTGNGECIAEDLKPPYESVLFNSANNHLREAWEVFAFLDNSKPELIVAKFEFGYLAIRRASGHSIVIVAEPTVNMAMINVGMNVAVLRLAEGEGSASAKISVPQSQSQPNIRGSNPGHTGTGTGTGSGVNSAINALRGNSGPQGLSWTSPSGGGTLVIPPDAVGEQVVGELVTMLSKYVGPFAKVMVKEELKGLGAHPRTLRRAAWRDLLDAIVRGIPQQEQREAFIADAKKLLPQ